MKTKEQIEKIVKAHELIEWKGYTNALTDIQIKLQSKRWFEKWELLDILTNLIDENSPFNDLKSKPK